MTSAAQDLKIQELLDERKKVELQESANTITVGITRKGLARGPRRFALPQQTSGWKRAALRVRMARNCDSPLEDSSFETVAYYAYSAKHGGRKNSGKPMPVVHKSLIVSSDIDGDAIKAGVERAKFKKKSKRLSARAGPSFEKL